MLSNMMKTKIIVLYMKYIVVDAYIGFSLRLLISAEVKRRVDDIGCYAVNINQVKH
jgi:hypothetical protein